MFNQKQSKSRVVVTTAMFLALGVLFPFLLGHAAHIPGNILLPMHIPVLICGLLCGPVAGLFVGILSPILSSIFTGMPGLFPMCFIMTGELGCYGFVSGLLAKKTKLPMIGSLIIAMISGRIVYGALFAILFLGGTNLGQVFSVSQAFIKGIPGIVIQLLFVPKLVKVLQKYIEMDESEVGQVEESAVLEAKARIKENRASCVVIKEGEIIYSGMGRGIAPLIELFENHNDLLKNSIVVDKIIGKAAAMILFLSGVKSVYGITMSRAGKEYLESKGIAVHFERCIDVIENRKKNGICPMEMAVIQEEDAYVGYEILKEKCLEMRQKSTNRMIQ